MACEVGCAISKTLMLLTGRKSSPESAASVVARRSRVMAHVASGTNRRNTAENAITITSTARVSSIPVASARNTAMVWVPG